MLASLGAGGSRKLDCEDGEDVTCEAPELLHAELVS